MGMGTGGHDPLGQKSGRPESEMHRLLHGAFDLGINYFDTSPGYLDSELILGRALKSLSREKLIISTKIPLAGGDPGQVRIMRPEKVVETVETSLRRLQLSEIDIMLMAVATPEYHDVVMNDQLPVLQRLQREGKIRFLGSSEQSRSDGSHEWLQVLLPHNVIDVAMVAHNLINQSAQRTVFPVCKAQNLGVINVFTVRNVFSQSQRLQEVIQDLKTRSLLNNDRVQERDPLAWVVEMCRASSLVEVAYRYAAYTAPVKTVMNGTLLLHELEEDILSIEKGPLPDQLVEELREIFSRVAEPIGN